jgi:glycyl-tRNA synthetase beta chain
MSYQRPDGATVQFVRPAHALIALHGDTVLPLTLLGLTGSNVTEGHRFLTARASAPSPSPTPTPTPPR